MSGTSTAIRLTCCSTDSDPAIYLIIYHQQRKPQHAGLDHRKDKDKHRERACYVWAPVCNDTHTDARISAVAVGHVGRLSLRRTTQQSGLLEMHPIERVVLLFLKQGTGCWIGHNPLLSSSQ